MSSATGAVERLALGSAQWGATYGIANTSGPPSEDELARLFAVAIEGGVTTIDTAADYPASEDRIGRLSDGRWRIVTKVTATLEGVEDPKDAVRLARRSLDTSRRRLRRPVLDAVLLHRAPHRVRWRGAVWQELVEQAQAGRIGRVGVSAGSPAEAFDAIDDPTVGVVQVASSIIDQRLGRAGFFGAADSAGCEIFIRSVFLQGVAHLPVDDLPPHLGDLRDPLNRIRQFAKRKGWKPFGPFLAYAASLGTSRILVGSERSAQIVETLAQWAQVNDCIEEVRSLAADIPVFDEQILDPSQWR